MHPILRINLDHPFNTLQPHTPMSFRRAKKSTSPKPSLTPELDAEIQNLNRLITKNENLREQIRMRSELLEDGDHTLTSPTRRESELRTTSQALREENEMLEYKMKLRKRLRKRTHVMRSAADATWRAYGGRGKTRDLALSHAKVSALKQEVEVLQSTHLEALRQGMDSRLSTQEANARLELAVERAGGERDRRIIQEKQCTEKCEENQRLKKAVIDLRARVSTLTSQLDEANVKEARLKSNEHMLKRSVGEEQTRSEHLKHRLAAAKIDADSSAHRERKLRVHIAAATAAVAATTDPYTILATDPYALGRLGGSPSYSHVSTSYNLSPNARRYYLENIMQKDHLDAQLVYETEKIRQIDDDLAMASAIDRDVDEVRRQRDRQRLALLRAENNLGLGHASDTVERTLLESKIEIDDALGTSGGSYLSRMMNTDDI